MLLIYFPNSLKLSSGEQFDVIPARGIRDVNDTKRHEQDALMLGQTTF